MRRTDKERILKARPVFVWCFAVPGVNRTPASIYWHSAGATERICRAMNRQYHEAGMLCVRVKVSIAGKQRTGALPAHLRGCDWRKLGSHAWKRPGCSQGGEWVWKERRRP